MKTITRTVKINGHEFTAKKTIYGAWVGLFYRGTECHKMEFKHTGFIPGSDDCYLNRSFRFATPVGTVIRELHTNGVNPDSEGWYMA